MQVMDILENGEILILHQQQLCLKPIFNANLHKIAVSAAYHVPLEGFSR